MTDADSIKEELKWNAYFIDSVYESIETEVRQVIEQSDKELSDEKIEELSEHILNNGINSL